jgi:hypothetical protein
METCENGKKIPERSRSVLGRFYCIYYMRGGLHVSTLLSHLQALKVQIHTIISATVHCGIPNVYNGILVRQQKTKRMEIPCKGRISTLVSLKTVNHLCGGDNVGAVAGGGVGEVVLEHGYGDRLSVGF